MKTHTRNKIITSGALFELVKQPEKMSQLLNCNSSFISDPFLPLPNHYYMQMIVQHGPEKTIIAL